MPIIAKDSNPPYTSLDEQLRHGKVHRGSAIGDVVNDNPSYVQFLIDKGIITVAGDVEEALITALEKYEAVAPGYTRDDNVWDDGIWDHPSRRLYENPQFDD